MSNELVEHRVAIVVFTTVRAVDFADAAYVAETGIRQSLKTCSIENPELLTVNARFGEMRAKVHVHKFAELTSAANNGLFKTEPSLEAYRRRS